MNKQFKLMSPVGRVYTVDGAAVRKKHPDFIGGSHNLVDSFVPKHEVWIERMCGGWREERFLLAHEMTEIVLMMVRRWPYEKAHAAANVAEQRLRAGACPDKVFIEFLGEHFPNGDPEAAVNLGSSLTQSYRKYG